MAGLESDSVLPNLYRPAVKCGGRGEVLLEVQVPVPLGLTPRKPFSFDKTGVKSQGAAAFF